MKTAMLHKIVDQELLTACFVLITFSTNEPPKTAIETSMRIVPNHNNLPRI